MTTTAEADGEGASALAVELDGIGARSAVPAGPPEVHPMSTASAAVTPPTLFLRPVARAVRASTVQGFVIGRSSRSIMVLWKRTGDRDVAALAESCIQHLFGAADRS
jgi:hypothetical protein